MVRTPETGGDTIFVSQYALFSQLSKPYQKLLEGLHATHTSEVSQLPTPQYFNQLMPWI
jgi:Probable taurine catabolism dioxygenase